MSPADNQRLEEIFGEAIEIRQPDERKQFLLQACQGDEGLRQTIEELLALCEANASFLERPISELDPALFQSVVHRDETSDQEIIDQILAHARPDTSGDSLGWLDHYRIDRCLGHGGAGVVFEAIDSNLNRTVALKILSPHLAADDKYRERFLAEARAMAQLDHPNIVRIYAVHNEGPLAYLAMECVVGETLADRLKRDGQLPPKDITELGSQIAEAIAAMHAMGIVHCDIKPENILLPTNSNKAKVGDFGLFYDAHGARERRVAGTPKFMAPEQVDGEACDERTDIFAFGSVLYAMAAGDSPFVRDSRWETLLAVREQPAISLSQSRTDLAPAFVRLVDHMLQKRPEQRPSSMQQVQQALHNLPSTGRHRYLLPLILLLVLCAATLVAFWSMGNRTRPADTSDGIVRVGETFKLSLNDDRHLDFLYHYDNAVIQVEEEYENRKYWRPENVNQEATIIYRFPFDKPIRRCSLVARVLCAFKHDPNAQAYIDISVDGSEWTTIAKLDDRTLEWDSEVPSPGPFITSLDSPSWDRYGQAFTSEVELTNFLVGKRTLFVRARLTATKILYETVAEKKQPIGPAGAQFLRSFEKYRDSPLILDTVAE